MSALSGARSIWQFGLRDLLAWTWCIGAIAASMRQGLTLLLIFGLPLSILGYQAIARTKTWHWPGWRFALRTNWPVVVCSIALAVILLCWRVRPLDMAGGMALAGGVLWSAALASARRRFWRALAPTPLLGFAYLLLCVNSPQHMERFIRGVPGSVLLQDVRGGRNGIQLFSDFSFSWPGPNTALIEEYLGPLEPEWEQQWYLSRGYAGQEERVNRQSIIRRSDLPEILAMLPSAAARRQALACVTNPKNLARVHQGMWLVAIKIFGYPQGSDVESWWRQDAKSFRSTEDPDEASRLVYGWRSEVELLANEKSQSSSADLVSIRQQLDAAANQEMGIWGGDDDFSQAYFLTSVREGMSAAESE
jgi:hypothetical protein